MQDNMMSFPSNEQSATIEVATTFEDGMTFTHTVCASVEANDIILSSVIKELKTKGLCFDSSMISYLTRDGYKFNCWCDPIPDTYLVPESEVFFSLDGRGTLKLFVNRLEKNSEESDESTQDESKPKRSKERTISEVRETVEIWKRICHELKEAQPDAKQVAEKAFEYVGIPKKSLDDYLHQIKLGAKYNFKFDKHGRSKIGRLRKYNKKHEEKERENGVKPL